MGLLRGAKMTKNSITLLMALFTFAISLFGFASFAWFSKPTTDLNNVGGGAITNYFHCGNGSQDDPFVITVPRHYYNLVNLYQRVSDYSDNHYYFQVGYNGFSEESGTFAKRFEMDENGNVTITEQATAQEIANGYWVYLCNDDGTIVLGENNRPIYVDELNLQCYDGRTTQITNDQGETETVPDVNHPKLLPIGTQDKNFLSCFDGKDIKIKNLYITIDSDVITQDQCDIGIFGYVGAGVHYEKDENGVYIVDEDGNYVIDTTSTEKYYDEIERTYIRNVYFENVNIDLTNLSATILDYSDLNASESGGEQPNTSIILNATHKAESHNSGNEGNYVYAYVGMLAGHVCTVADITNVFLNNVTIDGGTFNLNQNNNDNDYATSNFGYFGCIEKADGSIATSVGDIVSNGKDAGWGGSLDMYNIFQRLEDIHDFANTQTNNNDVKASAQSAGNLIYSNQKTVSIGGKTSYVGDFQGYLDPTFEVKYVTNQLVIEDEQDNLRYDNHNVAEDKDGWLTFIRNDNRNYTFTHYVSDFGGEYYYEPDMRYSNKYMCLFGESSLNKKTVTTIKTVINENGEREILTAFYIADGENYLTADKRTLTAQTLTQNQLDGADVDTETFEFGESSIGVKDLTKTKKWIYDSVTKALYCYVNDEQTTDGNAIVKLYLNKSGNKAVLGNTQTTSWEKVNNDFYVSEGANNYYLVYDKFSNEWFFVDSLTYYVIGSGNNYLSVNSSKEFINVTDSDLSVRWYKEGDKYFTYIDGVKNYLYCVGNLSLNTSVGTEWQKDANNYNYVDIGGVNYYLCFNPSANNGGGSWFVSPMVTYSYFYNGNNYLRVVIDPNTNQETLTNTNDISQATAFYFSNGATSTGTVFCVVNGNKKYLNVQNGLLVFGNSGSTSWSSNLSYVNGDTTYSIVYESESWKFVGKRQGNFITDGVNYLRLNGTTIQNTTDISQATPFTLSNNRLNATGSNYYIHTTSSDAALTVTQTNNPNNTNSITRSVWSNSNGKLSCVYNGGTTRYLVYDNGWKLSVDQTYYIISSGGNYLTNNSTTLTNTTVREQATKWIASATGNSATLSTTTNNRTYYLQRNNSALRLNTNATTWTITTGNEGSIYSSSWFFGTTYYYINFSNDVWTSLSTSAKNVTVEMSTLLEGKYATLKNGNTASPTTNRGNSVDNSAYRVNLTETPNNNTLFISSTKKYSFTIKIKRNENGGYVCYFPLKVERDKNEDATNPFDVEITNTGYIVGGAGIVDTSANANQKGAGDIRISKWDIDDIGMSWDKGEQEITAVKTVGDVYIDEKEGLIKNDFNITLSGSNRKGKLYHYDETKSKLEEILRKSKDQEYIYGLHFMDSTISKDRVTVAPNIKILNRTMQNYELPLDCIDFNVERRGFISFFAGDYFTNTNSFFSLYKIYRNDKTDINTGEIIKYGNKIIDIKEILEVYIHSTDGIKAPYVYKLKGENDVITWGTYVFDQNNNKKWVEYGDNTQGTTDLLADYQIIFDTKWIKEPTGVTTGKNLYYFEIPCNEGEYALGSVSGKNGAYLVYLDIGANGGGVVKTDVSSSGNELTKCFYVDMRSKGAEKFEFETEIDEQTGEEKYVRYKYNENNQPVLWTVGDEEEGFIKTKDNIDSPPDPESGQSQSVKNQYRNSILQYQFDALHSVNPNEFSVTVTYKPKAELSQDDGLSEDDINKYFVDSNGNQGGLYIINITNKTDNKTAFLKDGVDSSTDEYVSLIVMLCDNNGDANDNSEEDYPFAYKIIYTNKTNTTPTTISESVNSQDIIIFKRCQGFKIFSEGDAVVEQ